MNKELMKSVIMMFLENEKETYKVLTGLNVHYEVREESLKRVNFINILEKHLESGYEDILEIISKNLNKNDKKSSKKK